MKIQASVGNAPHHVSLCDAAYSLRLVAETEGEKQLLAGLYRAILTLPPAVLRKAPPKVTLTIEKDDA